MTVEGEERASPLTLARRRDVDRRRQRVQDTLSAMLADGSEITLSSVANRARVHRSFLHRHLELRAAVIAAADEPNPPHAADLAGVSRRSLLADVENLRATNRRLSQHIADLEHRLSELLGEQVFASTGLGAPRDHAALQTQVETLQQQMLDQQRLLDGRAEELGAAREAHRRLMSELNRRGE